jgi:centromere/kinetochore protein ZW10
LVAEIQFNKALTNVLGRLQLIWTTISQADVEINRGDFNQAIMTLNGAEEALQRLQNFDQIIIVGLMNEKILMLRKAVVDRVERAWNELVTVNKEKSLLTVRKKLESKLLECRFSEFD